MKGVFIRLSDSVSVDAAVAHLEGLGYENRWRDGYVPQEAYAIVGECTGGIGWCSTKECPEDFNLQEIFIPAAKHKHYGLIVAWAADTTQKVWYYNGSGWLLSVIDPVWNPDYTYHIGDAPPKRKIMIGDTEIDAPELSELARGCEYFLPNASMPELYSESRWTNDHYDSDRLKRGQIHLNKEAAIAHAKALINVSGGCVDE